MNFIWDKITEWLKGLLVSGIISNLSGLFDAINTRVGEAAAVVGTTPQAWHGGIFQMIRSLSENVVVPIAGIILTFIMCLELIQMLIDRNSLHDFDTFLFFKWIFKTFAAVLIVTNTWNIVMAVFDVAQNVVSQASGIIIGDTALDAAALLGDMEQALMAMEIGPLFGLWFQSSLMGILAWVLSICIFIVIYGRMIEIYMVTSIAPIPMATMVNREWGQMGSNYLRSLFALIHMASTSNPQEIHRHCKDCGKQRRRKQNLCAAGRSNRQWHMSRFLRTCRASSPSFFST